VSVPVVADADTLFAATTRGLLIYQLLSIAVGGGVQVVALRPELAKLCRRRLLL